MATSRAHEVSRAEIDPGLIPAAGAWRRWGANKQCTRSILCVSEESLLRRSESVDHPCSKGNTWYAQSGGFTARRRQEALIASDQEVCTSFMSALPENHSSCSFLSEESIHFAAQRTSRHPRQQHRQLQKSGRRADRAGPQSS